MTKRKVGEKDITGYSTPAPSEEGTASYSREPSRKRMKMFETTPMQAQAPKRNNIISMTTFNGCNSHAGNAVPPFASGPGFSIAPTSTMMIESREQPDDDSGDDAQEEMRDLMETMRDILSERGCTKTC